MYSTEWYKFPVNHTDEKMRNAVIREVVSPSPKFQWESKPVELPDNKEVLVITTSSPSHTSATVNAGTGTGFTTTCFDHRVHTTKI
jgi:hypothetical protein